MGASDEKRGKDMPSLAKAYIAGIGTIAALILGVASYRWNPENFGKFLLFFALAMVASAMKIRLPGLKTSISINFVFILIGIALFSFSETVLIGLGGALVQSLWKPLQRPKPVQIFFNGACLTVCTGAAFWAAHALPAAVGSSSIVAMTVVGACTYVVLNTGLVSLVICLVEGQTLRQIWSQCYEWTFPYFLVGAAVAGLASVAGQGSNLGLTLLVVPAMYFVYVYYRMRIVRAVLESISTMSQETEPALMGVSRGH
jgi:hypothetical protein